MASKQLAVPRSSATSKKFPAREASIEHASGAKAHLSPACYVERLSEDLEMQHQSHEEWLTTSELTAQALDRSSLLSYLCENPKYRVTTHMCEIVILDFAHNY